MWCDRLCSHSEGGQHGAHKKGSMSALTIIAKSCSNYLIPSDVLCSHSVTVRSAYLPRARTHQTVLTLRVTACNHRRLGPQSSVGFCPHSVRLSAGPNPQSVRPSPHRVRRTRNHRVGTEIRETEGFASLP